MTPFVRQPFSARFLYPGALFRVPGFEKKLCLTFDDGPDPDITPEILDILAGRNLHATFFCTGKKVLNEPGIFARIASEGHSVGNHGFNHFDGRITPVRKYCSDVMKGRDITCSNYFRPPFGHIRMRQYKIIERSSHIIFWDIMPCDFDSRFSEKQILELLRHNVRPGSLIAMNEVPGSKAASVLSSFIDYALDSGYKFLTLDEIFK